MDILMHFAKNMGKYWIAIVLIQLSVLGTCVYVAHHFITKYW